MTISREQFGERYGNILNQKFHRVHDQAMVDDEYASYCAIVDLVGIDADFDMVLDSSGQIHVIVTPAFPSQGSQAPIP